MLKKIKLVIKKYLYTSDNPYVSFFTIKYLFRKNIYINKKYLSRKLFNKLKKLRGYNFFKVTGTGVLLLIYDKSIIKIPLGETSTKALKTEFENYTILKNSEYSDLVEYNFKQFDNFYKMEKLETLKDSNDYIKIILKRFNNENKVITLESFIKNGCIDTDILAKYYGIKCSVSLNTSLKSVVMHGDLTQNNIMKKINSRNKIVLIDLDRFTFNGVQGIDQIHFEVDKNSKKQGTSFFQYLENLLNKRSYEPIQLYIYFLYRISQEYRKNIVLDQSYYNEVKRLDIIFTKRLQ